MHYPWLPIAVALGCYRDSAFVRRVPAALVAAILAACVVCAAAPEPPPVADPGPLCHALAAAGAALLAWGPRPRPLPAMVLFGALEAKLLLELVCGAFLTDPTTLGPAQAALAWANFVAVAVTLAILGRRAPVATSPALQPR